MHEGDAASVGPRTGYLIDEAVARFAAALEGALEIGNVEADVVDAGPVLREVLADGALGVGGGEELDFGAAEREADDRGAVGGLRRMGRHAEDVAVEAHRLIQVP